MGTTAAQKVFVIDEARLEDKSILQRMTPTTMEVIHAIGS
jgi:hypothetical protein